MPTAFTDEETERIRSALIQAGIRLSKELGLQRMSVEKLTAAVGIAKGSFYLFFGSKEDFILAVAEYMGAQTQKMLLSRLNGRRQMSAHEFMEFFSEYLHSDFDLMNGLTIGLLNVVLYGFGWLINILYAAKKGKGMPFFRTYFHRMGTTNVYRLAKILWRIDLRPIADKLTKYYLIIGGSRDSMACRAGLGRHLLVLRKARSVSSREITEFEQGADHCCCGNQTAAMDAVLLWAEMMEFRDRSLDDLQ